MNLAMPVLFTVFVAVAWMGVGDALGATPASPSPAKPSIASNATAPRPACPTGWTAFQNPLIGMQAHVPTNYWVRLRGGTMLTVEKQEHPDTVAFLLPFKPKAGVKAAEIAERFNQFVAESEPRFKAQVAPGAAPDLARAVFQSAVSDQPVEGKYTVVVAAGGTMAYIIGVMAPEGQLEKELSTLRQIAGSFAFVPPQGKWIDYQSPAANCAKSIVTRREGGWGVKGYVAPEVTVTLCGWTKL